MFPAEVPTRAEPFISDFKVRLPAAFRVAVAATITVPNELPAAIFSAFDNAAVAPVCRVKLRSVLVAPGVAWSKNKFPAEPVITIFEVGVELNTLVALLPLWLANVKVELAASAQLPDVKVNVPRTVALPARVVLFPLFKLRLWQVVLLGRVWLAAASYVMVPVELPLAKLTPSGKGNGLVLCVRKVPLCVAVVNVPNSLLVPIFSVPPVVVVSVPFMVMFPPTVCVPLVLPSTMLVYVTAELIVCPPVNRSYTIVLFVNVWVV